MSASAITVALATPRDIPEIVALHEEMFAFNNHPSPGRVALESDIMEAGPGGTEMFRCLLARAEDGTAAGLIVFSDLHVPGVGKTAFMQDLFVSEASRRGGVGRCLMKALADLARAENWARIDWRVERLNLDARVFYDLLAPDGFRLHKLSYRLDRADIERIAALD